MRHQYRTDSRRRAGGATLVELDPRALVTGVRPTLILLNGPPASGKSTLASIWSDWESGPVAVDIDAIRHDRPSWPSEPLTAGLEARGRAVQQIDELLAAGRDVIVPQFLVWPNFIDVLAATAEGARARFVECALLTGRSVVIDSFVARAAAPVTAAHADANVLVDDDDVERDVGDMYDAFTAFVSTRPQLRSVEVLRGDSLETLRRLVEAVSAS